MFARTSFLKVLLVILNIRIVCSLDLYNRVPSLSEHVRANPRFSRNYEHNIAQRSIENEKLAHHGEEARSHDGADIFDGKTQETSHKYSNRFKRAGESLSTVLGGKRSETEDHQTFTQAQEGGLSGRRKNHNIGFYNVQTGDEFYLNNFEMHPKFKTKHQSNTHTIEYEYSPSVYPNSFPMAGQSGVRNQNASTNTSKINCSNTQNRPVSNATTNTNKPTNKLPVINNPPNIVRNKNRKGTAQGERFKNGTVHGSSVKRPNNRKCVKKTPKGVKVLRNCINRNAQARPIKDGQQNVNKNINHKRKTICNTNHNKKFHCNQLRKGNHNRTKLGQPNNLKSNKPKHKRTNTNRIKNVQHKNNQNSMKAINIKEKNGEHGSSKIDVIGGIIKKYLSRLQEKFYGLRNGRNTTVRIGDSIEGAETAINERVSPLASPSKILKSKFETRNDSFTIIQIHNFKCVATSASHYYEGKCYYPSQCKKLSGQALGQCADGFGVCCVFINSCGGVSGQNCSYFESPGYSNYIPMADENVHPSEEADLTTTYPEVEGTEYETYEEVTEELPEETTTYASEVFTRGSTEDLSDEQAEESEAGILILPTASADPRNKYKGHSLLPRGVDNACTYTVYKLSNDVQQMRIDFEDLELTGPTDGECLEERLMITGKNINIGLPAICGYISGQHVYVDVAYLTGPLQISVLSNELRNRRFKIRICQLIKPCGNSLNCLQFFTGVEGVISSFNYDRANRVARSNPEYLNNLNYAICIRREAGYCSITYNNIKDVNHKYPFELVNINTDDTITVSDDRVGMGPNGCQDDYIVIDNVRLCGGHLNGPITDASAGPIVIPVRTNQRISGRGFKLLYRQNKCSIT